MKPALEGPLAVVGLKQTVGQRQIGQAQLLRHPFYGHGVGNVFPAVGVVVHHVLFFAAEALVFQKPLIGQAFFFKKIVTAFQVKGRNAAGEQHRNIQVRVPVCGRNHGLWQLHPFPEPRFSILQKQRMQFLKQESQRPLNLAIRAYSRSQIPQQIVKHIAHYLIGRFFIPLRITFADRFRSTLYPAPHLPQLQAVNQRISNRSSLHLLRIKFHIFQKIQVKLAVIANQVIPHGFCTDIWKPVFIRRQVLRLPMQLTGSHHIFLVIRRQRLVKFPYA